MKKTINRQKTIKTILVTLITLLVGTIFACILMQEPQTVKADSTDTTYTTTDRLYLAVPSTDKTMTFTTIGGEVNGGVHSATLAQVTDTLSDMRNWFDVYITRSNGNSWYVPTSAAVNDKWYFDSTYAIKDAVYVWLEVKNEMPNNKLYTFLCNGDKLWQSRQNPYLAHPCSSNCSLPVVKVTTGSGTLYNGNPFTDSRALSVQQTMSIGAGNGWKVTSHNMNEHSVGINPTIGSIKLTTVSAGAGTCTISFDYYVGAYITRSNIIAGPGQNANRAIGQHDAFSISFSTTKDTTAPSLTVSDNYSKTSVSASWVDSYYSFATYAYNGVVQGEYTKNTSFKAEGKYTFTAIDCVGNTTNKVAYVDRTAPKFSSEFYDAAGTAITKISNSKAVVSWANASAYESPIRSCTYIRQYYDSATGTIKSDSAKTYTQNASLTAEGRYTFTLTDSAGNSSTATYIVDKTAPTITYSNIASKTSVSAKTTYTDVETEITMTYSLNGGSATPYRSGQSLSSEGKYIITATDKAGNTSSTTLYVDKTAPKLTYDDIASKTSVATSWTVGINESPVTTTYVYTAVGGTSAKTEYTSGKVLTNEGKYVITATDEAGNSATVTLYVDRTPPTATVTSPNKSSVRASFSTAVYESPITATVQHNGDATVVYTSNTQLKDEGRYVFTITDSAGNTVTQTTYIDKTAPTLNRSFEYGNSDGYVTFSANAYESPITATYSFTGNGSNKTGINYTSGTKLTDDGKYVITAIDEAGNSSSTTLYVDKEKPTLIYSDGTSGSSQITNASTYLTWTVKSYESPITTVYDFLSANESKAPSATSVPYTSSTMLTAEGTYEFTATDRAGNSTVAKIIIDNTPPTLTFMSQGIEFKRYTNTAFTANGVDKLSGIETIELYENGKYVKYDFLPRSDNGEYLFRISDKAGNITSGTVTVYKTDTFGNLASIRDSYKINTWYVVTLPSRIFTTSSSDIAGRYSFESYDKALTFAIDCERKFRVTKVQGGYMYVSSSNESIAQKYDDENTLNSVIEKYAKNYVSTRQYATVNGNDKFYTEQESLTRNNPTLPDYLLELKDLPRYFAKSTTSWNLPNISYISQMSYTVTARYLGDFAEVPAQSDIIIPNGTSLNQIDNYRQGYYLITETDEAGNVERYIIYSDAELPTVRVTATFGDGEKNFVLNYDYVQNETLYFISLKFECLLDNTDEFVMLKIEKGNKIYYYTQADVLPILGSDEYTSGKYTVTIYDRSLNALTFDVFIAGSEPTMTHGSLTADRTDCKISFVTSDKYNVITGITLYKIEYDGSKTILDIDGNGTTISAATLSYTLTVGGKYGATVTDNYRRTVELTPIFFLKGLPNGKLSGVSDGGRTNQNVAFTFDAGDVCEIYILLSNGERQAFTDYTVQTGSSDKTYNITASELTSNEYLIFLHNAQDMSLYVEYTFEIDTILPEFKITDIDGNVIEPDGATNKAFSISWAETGVTVRYYTAKGGSLSATKYNMNTVLTQGTLYYFTIKDDVGNTLDFTVLLDNAVDYTINGNYNEVNRAMYSNTHISFTVNEPTQEFSVKNVDGYSIDNGGTLTQEGRYEITVTDNYRNTITLIFILDFTPPTIELVGAENGGAVSGNVAISAFDYDYLYLTDSRGNKLKNVTDGEIFSSAGKYYVTASDYAGNSVSVSFTIDLTVDYTLSVPNGAVTTDKVTLDTAEPLNVTVKLNDIEIESTTKFTDSGTYELTLTDELGNSVTCVFTIISKKSQTLNQQLPVGTKVVSVLRNNEPYTLTDTSTLTFTETGMYSVTLDCNGTLYELTVETDNTPPTVTLIDDGKEIKVSEVDKDDVELTLTLDGEEINCRIGQTLTEPGHYVLTATDILGNTAVYEFNIPFRLNTWAIVAIVVTAIIFLVIVILIIRARRKPRLI